MCVQVLRYERGGRYTHHFDWFDPKSYQQNEAVLYVLLSSMFW